MSDEKKINPHPQKMKWTTVLSTPDFAVARAKADAVKGKVKRRPNGTFDVRVGVAVKEAKEEGKE
jgi:hypothetical protein